MPDQTKVYDSPGRPAATGGQPNTVKVYEEKKSSMAWLWWLLIPLLILIGLLIWWFNRTPVTANHATKTTMGAVYFATGSSALTQSDQQALNGAAAQMKQNPDMRLEVKGYTDSVGDQANNIALSNQRAGTVKQYLGSHGINDSRLDVKGFGQAPSAENGTGSDQSDRRVELIKE